MKIKSIRFLVLSVLIVSMFAFAACGNTEAPTDSGDNGSALSGKIALEGSTSVQPLAEMLAEAYMAHNPGVSVEVQGGGSSVGIKSVSDKTCDIGNASRNLKDSELTDNPTLEPHTIALDGIAIIVNASNPVKSLTTEQVQKIFKGEITNWSEVSGNDEEIIVFNREAASGTRGAFVELLELEEEDANGNTVTLITESALEANSNGALKTSVATKPSAIGYCSLATVDETVTAVMVDGVDASVENVKNGSYPIFRPFLMVTNGELTELTQSFLDFVFSEEGQAIVSDGWISAK